MVCEMAESAREREGDESGGSDEYEYVTLTSAEVLEKLEEAWQNERFAPELLEHKTEVVDCVLEQIKEMEENLSHVGRGDFVAGIHRLELDRVQYVLRSYLRTRLEKIERHVLHVLEQEADGSSSSRLSPEELVFAKEYADNMEAHLQSLVLQHMPSNLQKLDHSKAVSRPNMDSYVFVRAVERTEQVNVDPHSADNVGY
ncbi:DNA replication complex GINS protein SLD5 [Geodia barretti]|uniref:DNA replication complex GINS protein SLD5 n=2 Tax=Geodia barretti TaxID=519541 RepID=A0AA35WYI4_GEOBA|nr:DNA replication complex GINS protein SLD5 [Geodia barretti]